MERDKNKGGARGEREQAGGRETARERDRMRERERERERKRECVCVRKGACEHRYVIVDSVYPYM